MTDKANDIKRGEEGRGEKRRGGEEVREVERRGKERGEHRGGGPEAGLEEGVFDLHVSFY